MRQSILLSLLLAMTTIVVGCPEPEPSSAVNVFKPGSFGNYSTNFQPQILSETRLNFGDMDAGESSSIPLEIRNVGKEVLVISGYESTAEFEVRGLDEELSVPVGESVMIRVNYQALDEEPRNGELVIFSNDPENPRWKVEIFANQRFPCLAIEPQAVDFGTVDPFLNETSSRDIKISNCSSNATTTFMLEDLVGEGFEAPLSRDETSLEPGEFVEISLTFVPTRSGAYEGQLIVSSNDYFEERKVVELRGYGKDRECPVAIITGSNPQGQTVRANPINVIDALPLDNIELSAGDSYDPEGQSVTYEWSLVGRPQDSAARLEPNLGSENVRLWLDLAGEYMVDLRVVSGFGVPSCQTARLRVRATADQDIHIQLVWDTPNDPNQQDSSGADMDVHLVHPNGQWDQTPYDCFWRNLNPDWATPREVRPDGTQTGWDDDPSLDIDDVSGWGPENINLDNPQNVRYSVGVHYFAHHGYGSSFSTIRVYIGGVLVHEAPRKLMGDQDFWHVADIDWAARQVIPVDTLQRGFPE